jgi:hypothetical protein
VRPQHHHRPDLDRPVLSRRDHRRVPQRHVQILAVQDVIAAELLLDLGKRPVAQLRLTVADPDGGRGLRRLQRLLSTRIPASAIAVVADWNSPSICMNSGVPGAGPASGSP